MKIALLLNGYLRTWNYAKHSLRRLIKTWKNKGVDIIIFINTWDTSKLCDIENNTKLDNFNVDELQQSLLLDLLYINNQTENTIKIYNSKLEILSDIKWFEDYHKITYLRYLATQNVKNFEQNNNLKFDIIYITRPDIWWFNNLLDINFLIPQNYEIYTFGDTYRRYTDNNIWQDFNCINDIVIGCNSFMLDIVGDEFWFLLSSPNIINKVSHSAQYFYYTSSIINTTNKLYNTFPPHSILRQRAVEDKSINLLDFKNEENFKKICHYEH